MSTHGPLTTGRRAPVPLAGIYVEWADGDAVRIGDLVRRPTVLVIPRYYGCLPCRDYLRQVSRRLDELDELDVDVLGVSVGAAHQARWLADEAGVRFPLLVDRERRVYDALDLPRKWWVTLNPRGWWTYVRAMLRGNRQGSVIEPNQLPGLAILDAEANVAWVHRGRALGDYPRLDEVIARVRRMF